MKRYITLAGGVRLSLHSYTELIRRAKQLPPDTTCIRTLNSIFPDRADSLIKEFRQGLHARINRHVPRYGIGRHWSDNYQRSLAQLSPRIGRRIRGTTDEYERILRASKPRHEWLTSHAYQSIRR